MGGTQVGSYEITERLGKGGMAVVWRAVHALLGKKAVVKVLRPEYSADQEVVRRFFNEAKATTLIEHPGIVQIFDFGFLDDGRAYIVMELMNGESLSERRRRVGKMRLGSALRICRHVAGALRATHEHGIIHRDLKPDNVFLVPDEEIEGGERAKVLDFGVAKLGRRKADGSIHTQTGVILGTPAYMAPEQCAGDKDIDHRADIYSLGCILYKLLTGRTPFVYSGAGNMIAAQITEMPQPPSDHANDIPFDVDQLVMKLLEKDPADRPQSMGEVYEELRLITLDLQSNATIDDPMVTPVRDRGPDTQVTTVTTMPRAEAEDLSSMSAATLRRYAVPLAAGLVAAGAILAFALSRGDDDKFAEAETAPIAAADAGTMVEIVSDAAPTDVVDTDNDEVAGLLEKTKTFITNEEWANAHAAAGEALALEPTNTAAGMLRDQAKSEMASQVTYADFLKCRDSDLKCLQRHFEQLPTTSIYRDRAFDRYSDAMILAEASADDSGDSDQPASKRVADNLPTDKKERDELYAKFLSDARMAAKSAQFGRGLRLCEKAIAIKKTSEAMMVCAIASCNLASASKARKYVGRIRSAGRRNMIRQICLRNGVKLDL